jgi:GT2 family glycosyltransferase
MDISAVIVSFEAEEYLPRCLESLAGQSVPFRRIVVVDNASRDASPRLAAAFPGVEALLLAENLGYAAAANLGIDRAGGDLVLVANADVWLDAEFNRLALDFFARRPQAALLSPLILRFDGRTVDSAGQERSWALHPRETGYGRPLARLRLEEKRVFSVCGAATVFARGALERLKLDGEYYDRDFFMFWEDFDIGWRASLLGLQAWVCPAVVARHFRSATLARSFAARLSLALARPAPLRFHLVKNRWLTLIKNVRLRRDWRFLPVAAAWDLLWIGALTIRSPKIIIALARSRPVFSRAWEKRKWLRDHE